MSGHYRKEKNCLNCGHFVEEHYCTQCGQPNLELKEPFWHFIGHSIGHYFHFDSKFFKTLVPLLTKPGQLTLDYLAGKRARYIHPVSLYIFVSIVYFLVVPHTLRNEKEDEHEEIKTEKQDSIKKAAALKKVKQELPEALPSLGMGNTVDSYLNKKLFQGLDFRSKTYYLDSLQKVQALKPTDSLKDVINDYQEIVDDAADSTYASYLARQQRLPEEERDSWWQKKIKKIDYRKVHNKEIRLDKSEYKSFIREEVKKYQPKQYFLLMPLLALFIMINFRKNRIYYIDHLVFTIHGMTAYFIISIITKPLQKYVFGLDSIVSDCIGFLVFAGIVWYLYSGLKLFYNRSRNVTIRKTITVMFMYSLALGISEWIVTSLIMYLMT